MAKKKATKKEVSRKEINGNVIITFDDGSVQIIPAAIDLTAEEAESIFGSEEEDEDEDEGDEEEDNDSEDSDEDSDDSEDDSEDDSDGDDEDEDEDSEEDDEDLTPEQLAGMDFEELEDLCDDKDLDTDPDDYDEDDIDKFRKAVAKELGITLPAAKKSGKKGKK